MRNYCSLADSVYLPQLVALYESLKEHSSEEFTLYVLAMDDECAETLQALNLSDVDVTRFGTSEFVLRSSRTWKELCWSMASIFTARIMNEITLQELTYLDADCYFFSDPKVIFDEIHDRSIAVIPHRWNEKDRKRLEGNGKFNVSLVSFKNNAIGRECLSTWARQCRERCSAKVGCGDQGYLDEWPAKYGNELCVIENIGAGLAPWNLANYSISEGPKVDGVPVVFHHYHEFRELPGENFRLTNYPLRDIDRDYIYHPYVQAYLNAKDRIEAVKVSA